MQQARAVGEGAEERAPVVGAHLAELQVLLTVGRGSFALGPLGGEEQRRRDHGRGQALEVFLRGVDLAGVERVAQLLGQRGAHGLLGRALAELDVEIGVGHAQHVQRGAQALHVFVGAVVGGHDEQARAVIGAAVDDAGGVELLELRLDAQGDAVGVLARGGHGDGVGLVAVLHGHFRRFENVRAAETVGGLGLVLLALSVGHVVDVVRLRVGAGGQQLRHGLAADVLNAEQLHGARAVGGDVVVQIVKITHKFPSRGPIRPLVFFAAIITHPAPNAKRRFAAADCTNIAAGREKFSCRRSPVSLCKRQKYWYNDFV